MKLIIDRDQLLKPLSLVTGVVERRQTLPILSNVYLRLDSGALTMIGTDLEVQMSFVVNDVEGEDGEVTVTARKLLDICRALPEGSQLQLQLHGETVRLQSGHSRFTLQTLPAEDFPTLETQDWEDRFKIRQGVLRALLEKTSFSMAQQDVRYFLNGVLFELSKEGLRAVATDGHRLAKSDAVVDSPAGHNRQAIVPRKAVTEMTRFLDDSDEEITVEVNPSHLRLGKNGSALITKLIDGKFPDYEAVMAQVLSSSVTVDRQDFQDVLSRAAILTNEKFRGVRIRVDAERIAVSANNPEQEEAHDEVAADYHGEPVEIGFNVTYLIDALKAIDSQDVEMKFNDGNSGCLLHAPSDGNTVYLVMPMRL